MAEQILSIWLSRMSNGAYYQFMDNTAQLVRTATVEVLGIKVPFRSFETNLKRLNDAMVVQRKDNNTILLNECNQNRQRCYVGLSSMVRSKSYDTDQSNLEAVRLIQNRLDAYGAVYNMPYDKQSAYLTNLCEDLQSADLAPSVQKLMLTQMVTDLKAANDAFIALNLKRAREMTVSETTITVRHDLDNDYRNLIDIVNAKSKMMEYQAIEDAEENKPDSISDDLDLLGNFIHDMNAMIKKIKDSLAQSAGRSKKGENDKPDPID